MGDLHPLRQKTNLALPSQVSDYMATGAYPAFFFFTKGTHHEKRLLSERTQPSSGFCTPEMAIGYIKPLHLFSFLLVTYKQTTSPAHWLFEQPFNIFNLLCYRR